MSALVVYNGKKEMKLQQVYLLFTEIIIEIVLVKLKFRSSEMQDGAKWETIKGEFWGNPFVLTCNMALVILKLFIIIASKMEFSRLYP